MKSYLLIFLMPFTVIAYAQNQLNSNKKESKKSGSNNLSGTWRLIEFSDLDSLTGKWTYPYGKNPRGYFSYTKTNIVNLNISAEIPLKISEDSAKKYNINLSDFVSHYSLGYFGTYSVDSVMAVVIHHVTGGSLPWYIDTDQYRPFVIKGDTLTIGDNKTWRRILVRAD